MLKFKKETEFKDTEIGKVPRNWEVKEIGEVGEVAGGTTPSTNNQDYWGGNIPWLTPKDLRDYDYIYISKGERNITKKAVEEASLKVFPKGTVLLTTRAPIGYVAVAKNSITTNQGFRNIIPYKVVSEYLYYYLKTMTDYLNSVAGGSTFGELTGTTLKQIPIPFPSPAEQSRIATVLSWFDDLIENKKHQNEILKKTAMAIFKSWFVDFEPFKDEKFVYNEELDREIPEGWEVKPIGEVAEFVKGLSYRSNELVDNSTEGEIFITLKIFKRGGGFRPEYKYYSGNRYSDEQIVCDGDLVIALTDMTPDAKVVGAPALVILPPDKDKGIISLDASKLDMPEYLKEYIYLYLKDSQEENSTFANGVNVLHLNLELFKNGKYIPIPPQPILQKFHSMVEPLFRKIFLNQKEIMALREIRDALLPQLVFGKLRVEEM